MKSLNLQTTVILRADHGLRYPQGSYQLDHLIEFFRSAQGHDDLNYNHFTTEITMRSRTTSAGVEVCVSSSTERDNVTGAFYSHTMPFYPEDAVRLPESLQARRMAASLLSH
jgi:hypothetical protein